MKITNREQNKAAHMEEGEEMSLLGCRCKHCIRWLKDNRKRRASRAGDILEYRKILLDYRSHESDYYKLTFRRTHKEFMAAAYYAKGQKDFRTKMAELKLEKLKAELGLK